MTPFNHLERLLSTEGLLDLRTTFAPPEGAYMVTYHQEDDTYRFCYFTHDTLDERSGSYSFTLHLKKELGSALEILFSEIDSKLYSISVDKERQSVASLALARLNLIIDRWSKNPSSIKYTETLPLLNNFRKRIENMLSSYIDGGNLISTQDVHEVVIQLPEGFSLPKMKLKAERLNIRQVALLFYNLKELNVILPYGDTSMSKIVSSLTGHSFQNLRADGFGAIQFIKDGLNKHKELRPNPIEDLSAVKKLLQDIIENIDSQIDKTTSKK